jgi:acyl carrier protein
MTTQEVCAAIERETGQAVSESTPIEALEMDSLEYADLLVTLDIPFEHASNCHTVGELVA